LASFSIRNDRIESALKTFFFEIRSDNLYLKTLAGLDAVPRNRDRKDLFQGRFSLNRSGLNIPNLLTAFRVMLVPFFIYLIMQPSSLSHTIAFGIFIFASLTDLIDGYLARRLHQETEFGKFLDPIADKFLVLAAFITFIFLSEQIQVWMVLCIVARDLLITCLRSLAIYQGLSLRTSRLAKVKTAFQMFSIIAILVSFLSITVRQRDLINRIYREGLEAGLSRWHVAGRNLHDFLSGHSEGIFFGLASFLPYYLLILTTAVTIISLLRYLATNYGLFQGPIPFLRPKKGKDPLPGAH
jgi:cardiolipin synthase